MKGEQLIIQLLRVKEQYKYKPCYTGETNIPNMIDDVITEINRLTSKSTHDKHYIALGKAVEKAFNDGYTIVFQDYDYVEDKMEVLDFIGNKTDLLEWAEGRE